MQLTQQELSPLHLQLLITIEPEDYKEKLDQELRKYRSKANLKGFRKGMAPLDVIKKMAGKPILAEVINELVSHAFADYLKQNNMDIFLEPIALEEIEARNVYSATQMNTYTFGFEIGVKPDFEVKGISPEDSYTEYDIEISDEMLEKEVENYRLRKGKNIETEKVESEKDLLQVKANELEGDQIKEGGVETRFSILVSECKDEAVKAAFMGKSVGDTVDFDIFELEDLEEDKVYKYLLKIEKDEDNPVGRMFRATIEKISRTVPADLNEEFFESLQDETVKNVDDLKEKFRSSYKSTLQNMSKEYLYREIMEHIIDSTDIQLPETFLKKYLKHHNPEIADEDIEKDFDAFKMNLRWNTIKDKLIEEFSLDITKEEIERAIFEDTYDLMLRYQIYDHNRFQEIVRNRMNNKDEVRKVADRILTSKMMTTIYDQVVKVSSPVSRDSFNEKYQAMADRLNKS